LEPSWWASTDFAVLHVAGVVSRVSQLRLAILQEQLQKIGMIKESEEVLVAVAGLEEAVRVKKADLAGILGDEALAASEKQLYSEMSAAGKGKNAVKSGGSSLSSAGAKDVKWIAYNEHVASKHLSWKDVVKNTRHGKAKYIHGTNVEQLERFAWENGKPTTNGRPWKVLDCEKIIGASEGIETQYMRIECSSNTIHGHPISPAEYRYLLK
jgi:hypothetical protein